MKISLESEEVEAIIEGHIRTMVVLDLTGKIIKTRSSGYSGYEVTIEDPEPEPEKKEIIEKLESGDHTGLQMTIEKAADIAYGHLDKEEAAA